jgi:outer membrane receptor protein involved in Fe transport
LVLTAGARVDDWKTSNGIRLETNTENNTEVRSDVIENQSDQVFNGRAGFSYRVSPMVSLRGAAYTGFRLPSINEFYRPFRVRNDITESNPNLMPEKTKGIDIGFDYVANDTTKFSAGFFVNHLENGVGNVTLALGPGFFPPTGFVPAGGSLRQRQNIDKIKAQGIEVQFSTELGNGFSLDAGYIHSTVKVTKFVASPTLEGKRLAQSPRDVLAVSLGYNDGGLFKLSGGFKYTSHQYDDDQNVRILPSYTLLNIVAHYKINDQMSLFASAQNLLDENYLTALSGAGLMTIGQPRTLTLGLRGNF